MERIILVKTRVHIHKPWTGLKTGFDSGNSICSVERPKGFIPGPGLVRESPTHDFLVTTCVPGVKGRRWLTRQV